LKNRGAAPAGKADQPRLIKPKELGKGFELWNFREEGVVWGGSHPDLEKGWTRYQLGGTKSGMEGGTAKFSHSSSATGEKVSRRGNLEVAIGLKKGELGQGPRGQTPNGRTGIEKRVVGGDGEK